MATRTLTYKAWLREVARHALGDGFNDLAGKPVADVVKLLGVSKQRVHQLILADRLDALHITTAAGDTALVIVTDSSLAKYQPQPNGVRLGSTSHA
jgi:hypothetical protein